MAQKVNQFKETGSSGDTSVNINSRLKLTDRTDYVLLNIVLFILLYKLLKLRTWKVNKGLLLGTFFSQNYLPNKIRYNLHLGL